MARTIINGEAKPTNADVEFTNYLQPDARDLFKVFSKDIPFDIDWKNAKVLDFGCNVGNFLNSATPFIKPENYTGIDLIKRAIDVAKENHTDSTFVHYDRWHQAYNPSGDKSITVPNTISEKFDVIIAYSVFTHTTMQQTRSYLDELKTCLTENGVILFSVWGRDIVKKFHNVIVNDLGEIPHDDDYADMEKFHFAYSVDYSKIVIDDVNYENVNCKSFTSFMNKDYFDREFPDCIYIDRALDKFSPVEKQYLYYCKNT